LVIFKLEVLSQTHQICKIITDLAITTWNTNI